MSEELMQPTTKDKFLTETDPKELQKIVDMFNLNIKKKNILRAERISEIQDNILNQISARVVKRPDEFSNTDLLNYFKAMQDTLLKNPTETELPEKKYLRKSRKPENRAIYQKMRNTMQRKMSSVTLKQELKKSKRF